MQLVGPRRGHFPKFYQKEVEEECCHREHFVVVVVVLGSTYDLTLLYYVAIISISLTPKTVGKIFHCEL